MKKSAIATACISVICLFFVSSCGNASNEETTNGNNVVIEETSAQESETENTEAKESETIPEMADKDTQLIEAMKWLEKNEHKGESLDKNDIEELQTKVSEENFFEAWKQFVLSKLTPINEYNSSFANIVTPAIEIYHKVWGDSEKIRYLDDDLSRMDNLYTHEMQPILSKYTIDLNNVQRAQNLTVYVINRMQNSSLDEAIQSFISQLDGNGVSGSYWYCTNVDYFYGNAMPGDEKYVIHSNFQNPFNKQGAYDILCTNLNTTLTVSDTAGFNYDAPVFELVDYDYNNNIDLLLTYNNELVRLYNDFMSRLYENPDSSQRNLSNESLSDSSYYGDTSEYIFYDSDARYLSDRELYLLSPYEARLAINEIAARHGRIFKDEELNSYFNSKSWYHGTLDASNFDDSVFNNFEHVNTYRLVCIRDEKELITTEEAEQIVLSEHPNSFNHSEQNTSTPDIYGNYIKTDVDSVTHVNIGAENNTGYSYLHMITEYNDKSKNPDETYYQIYCDEYGNWNVADSRLEIYYENDKITLVMGKAGYMEEFYREN